MAVNIILTSALLTCLMIPEVKTESCERGWFGDECMFKCQCHRSEICGRNGECPNFGRCDVGSFGPACQYRDLVSTDGSPTNEDYYQDGDDTTCNQNINDSSVVVGLEHPTPFLWIRIVVRDERYLLNFTLDINSNQACSNQRRYIVTPKVVDIKCDNIYDLKRIKLEGQATRYICSIFVSGGRNVALKQRAVQSPMLAGELNRASNAVDGNTDNVYERGSCTFSRGTESPWWSVTFAEPKIVFKATVFNRNTMMTRLNGFKLETFTTDGNRTNFVQNNDTNSLFFYDIAMTSLAPITSVKITAGSEILSLCEVQLFGDSLCPEGLYGLNCEFTCTCRLGELCSSVTGMCAPGCPKGYYGLNCSTHCPTNCYEVGCSPRDGLCTGCFPGFTGAQCEKPCEPGFYGHQCRMNCSENCVDVCNNQNGACKCENNYTGIDCTEQDCPIGMYGGDCSFHCSEFCHQSECLSMSGECIKCRGFREGKFCEDCPPKSYGQMCQKPCSQYCANGTCDKDTGNCPTCTNDYHGPQCLLSPTRGMGQYWIFAVLIPVLVMIAVVMIFFYGRKTKSSPSGEIEGES